MTERWNLTAASLRHVDHSDAFEGDSASKRSEAFSVTSFLYPILQPLQDRKKSAVSGKAKALSWREAKGYVVLDVYGGASEARAPPANLALLAPLPPAPHPPTNPSDHPHPTTEPTNSRVALPPPPATSSPPHPLTETPS